MASRAVDPVGAAQPPGAASGRASLDASNRTSVHFRRKRRRGFRRRVRKFGEPWAWRNEYAAPVSEPAAYIRRCECGRTMWARMVVLKDGQVVVIECRCGSWRCLRDSKRRGLKDAQRIAEGAIGRAIASGIPVCYFTLTLDQREAARRGVTVAGSFAFLRDQWWDLRRELARHGLLGEFVCSIEQHVSGWAHANVIGTGGYAEAMATGLHANAQADLVERATAIGFGPQCVLHKKLGRPGLFMYLAKYLGKSGQLPTAAPKGTRRMASSPRALAPRSPKRMEFLDWATPEEAAGAILARSLPTRGAAA
jgi:hypothetical protein